jgi:hypothetical protein
VEGRLSRSQLLKNFDAEPRLFHPPADASDLALDAVQTRNQRLLLDWF